MGILVSVASGEPHKLLLLSSETPSENFIYSLDLNLYKYSQPHLPQTQHSCTQHPKASSVQFSSVIQSCLTLCDPMDCRMPGFPVHHQLPDLAQPHVHRAGDSILSYSIVPFSCLQSFPDQSLFQWVSSSHQVDKVLEFQLQHQSFQWIFRMHFL